VEPTYELSKIFSGTAARQQRKSILTYLPNKPGLYTWARIPEPTDQQALPNQRRKIKEI